ncbi:hypothetical protein F511_17858 [Dorcoceras hygrometricum]|uniref:Uncharacterized protein n=1 Tax=Dorcoceras hygrometricum TaxID=472368 RepID=A0A2Z7C795_9LAMI|nr:hypothetical protein F511_17858 [Dorcoceras hygrometricum]
MNTATTSYFLNTPTQGSKLVPIERSREDKLSATNLDPNGGVNRRQSGNLCSDEHKHYSEGQLSSDLSITPDLIPPRYTSSRPQTTSHKSLALIKSDIRQTTSYRLHSTLVYPGIRLAVGSQLFVTPKTHFRTYPSIMVKRLATSPHDPLGITDSACKNHFVIVSVQYGHFSSNIPIESTTIDSIGYPCTRASDESSTTKHRILHASGPHPIPPPDDPNGIELTSTRLLLLDEVQKSSSEVNSSLTSLSSQLAEIEAHVKRDGDAKKGEGSSSRRKGESSINAQSKQINLERRNSAQSKQINLERRSSAQSKQDRFRASKISSEHVDQLRTPKIISEQAEQIRATWNISAWSFVIIIDLK